MSRHGRLTEKQRAFVEAYMGEAEGNATEAARMAGYSGNDNTLSTVGAENLRKPKIRAEIRDRVDSDPLVASRQERQAFWTAVMRGEEGDADLSDRMQASKLLGKSQADFVERREYEGTMSIEVVYTNE
jgi:phage terminase small subunit